jgi:hypothetical protein
MQATISMAPEMKAEGWKKFTSNLDKMTADTDTIEVDKVSLSDGMLYVSLLNVIPDNKKPKIFQIE